MEQGFSAGPVLPLPPRGHLALSGDIYWLVQLKDATGIEWVEATVAVQHPTMHGVPSIPQPPKKNYTALNAGSTKAENLFSRTDLL